jgi:hypothetical protein
MSIRVGRCRHSPVFPIRARGGELYGTPYTTLHSTEKWGCKDQALANVISLGVRPRLSRVSAGLPARNVSDFRKSLFSMLFRVGEQIGFPICTRSSGGYVIPLTVGDSRLNHGW